MRVLLASALLAAVAAPALAQPGKDKGGEKDDAKSLLASGLKLFAAKDFLGALSVFQTAYARFPSPKILINIGTTLIKLDRKAEAANTYQRFLDSPDADPAKLDEVKKVLAGLDASVGRVDVTVTPGDAEVQVGSGDWVAKLAHVRVTPGAVTIRARKAGFKPAEQSTTVAAGGVQVIALTLEAEPVVVTPPVSDGTGTVGTAGGGIRAGFTPEGPPSKLGFFGLAHIDPKNKGGAALLGVVYDVAARIQVQAAALLGPSSGAYAGATLALMTGKVRPLIAVGMPVFFSDGARVAARAAGGVELRFNPHIAVIAEIGVEHLFNPQDSVTPTLVIPALGVIGRL